jgi:hypothetical protein
MAQDQKQKHVDLKDLFLGQQALMVTRLANNREILQHPVAKGDASELEWLELLKTYLPERYQADKAFILDCTGAISEQVDVVIYDRQYSPFLLNHSGSKFIPAESVYAVFEVKQDISSKNIEYAGEKVASVRALRRTSAPIPHAGGTHDPKQPQRILAGLLALGSEWTPPFGAAFIAALQRLPPVQRLDLGCALQFGGFEIKNEDVQKVPRIVVSEPQVALIYFFLRLIARLQACGTVVAMDFDEYGRVL